MMCQRKTFLVVLSVILLIPAGLLLHSCEELELIRIAAVTTREAEVLDQSSAIVHAEIIDLGEENSLDEHGFCWNNFGTPTLEDNFVELGPRSSAGTYEFMIGSLNPGTKYQFRAYIHDGSGVKYGAVASFTTVSGSQSNEWLHWDDGTNFTGIGFTSTQTNFDVAVRFEISDLQPFNGYHVTAIRFYAKEGSPVRYHVTWWSGAGPELIDYEQVQSPAINQWTEYTPDYIHTINASEELWIGLWIVDAPAGYYPMGVDDGPALTHKGDLISTDDGDNWEALSIANPSLDYNWNIQVLVSNAKGETKQLKRIPDPTSKYSGPQSGSWKEISSKK